MKNKLGSGSNRSSDNFISIWIPCIVVKRKFTKELGIQTQGVRKKKNCYTGLFYLVKAS